VSVTTAKVIDISSWQHPGGAPIDFGAVAASGVQGVFIKATQGLAYANPFFAKDYEGAHAAGLMVGAYHFAVYTASEPEAQAQWFLSQTQGLDLELGRAVDCEEPYTLVGNEMSSWVHAFLDAIDQPACFASLYTNQDGLNHIISAPWGYRLWAAGTITSPGVEPWMQQGPAEAVAGVSGACDTDTLANIRSVNPPDGGSGAPLPVPPPVPELTPTTEVYPMNELAQGASGTEVKVLQFILNTKSGAALAIDGEFGDLTKAALVGFQAANGLATDGIAGPASWAKLLA
jgi:Glycosyl hydrolases family 25/Putative peptidoglycan binding domain